MSYQVKCDDCKATIRETDSLHESAAGGHCDNCQPMTRLQQIAIDRHRRIHNAHIASEEADWTKVGKKHYRHVSGVEIVYRPNAWQWEIVGGGYDGLRYERLWAAQHQATRVAAMREP